MTVHEFKAGDLAIWRYGVMGGVVLLRTVGTHWIEATTGKEAIDTHPGDLAPYDPPNHSNHSPND